MNPSIYITPNGQIVFRKDGVDIPFEDQTKAFLIIPGLQVNKKPDTLHPFPSSEYRVEVKEIPYNLDNGKTVKHYSTSVAVLIPLEQEATPNSKCTMNYCDENGCQDRKRELVSPLDQEAVESQDEIWDEAQLRIKEHLGTYSNDLVCDLARWAIEALRKHYILTRKSDNK